MGRHHQTYRQCSDCYHWVGHRCQGQPQPQPQLLRRAGESPTCAAFVRGSLCEIFLGCKPPPFTATPC